MTKQECGCVIQWEQVQHTDGSWSRQLQAVIDTSKCQAEQLQTALSESQREVEELKQRLQLYHSVDGSVIDGLHDRVSESQRENIAMYRVIKHVFEKFDLDVETEDMLFNILSREALARTPKPHVERAQRAPCPQCGKFKDTWDN